MSDKLYTPCNPNAQKCVKDVMTYLCDITYNKVITGQHTQSMAQEELHYIEDITGKQPALLGFELLSYSPNINYLDTDEACMTEITDNFGTLKRAWEWAQAKGLITFTWHWFSPLGGRSKAFYSYNTDFDASKAVIDGTPENKAFISDLDTMAGILRPFCDREIPILWRPFHEGDGNWFWWGVKGPETLKKLYRMMYDRYTNVHGLNNLIWVWNSPVPECYPGDDVVDIISRDMYTKPHEHTSFVAQYNELLQITKQPKLVLIGESGILPSVDAIIEEKVGWVSYMIWSHEFCIGEKFNSNDALKAVYNSHYAVTKDNLPVLY